MSWKVLITARTLNEVGTEAVKILRNAGCELTIPPRFGPYPADELQPLLSGHDAVFASMDGVMTGEQGLEFVAQSKAQSEAGW